MLSFLRSNEVQVILSLLCVGAILSYLGFPQGFGIPPEAFLVGLLVLGLAIALLHPGRRRRLARKKSVFLCDTCKYSNPRDCSLPDRPNALRCPEYRRR